VITVAEPAERGAVEPRAVQVATDQDHGTLARHRVEQIAVRHVRPERIAKSVSDKRRVVTFGVARDMGQGEVRRRGCGGSAREVDA